jgi:hypothetical protein
MTRLSGDDPCRCESQQAVYIKRRARSVPADGFERKTERARVRIWDLLRRSHGFAAIATQVLVMTLVLEALGLVIPIGFQLVR